MNRNHHHNVWSTSSARSMYGRPLAACAGAVIATLLAAPALIAADSSTATRTFVGYAFDPTDSTLLYKEVHHENARADGRSELSTVYLGPDGQTIAMRQVDFSEDPFAPRFRLDDSRAGYSEGLRRDGDSIVVYRQLSDRAEKGKRILSRPDLLVADAGFDRLVSSQWSRLVAGEEVRADFLVPSRLRTLRFVIAKDREWSLEGEPVVTFRMTSANPVLRLLISAIRVTYHGSDRFLMRYEGLSNIKASDGGMMRVRIDFPLEERSDWQAAQPGNTKVARYETD